MPLPHKGTKIRETAPCSCIKARRRCVGTLDLSVRCIKAKRLRVGTLGLSVRCIKAKQS